MSKAKMENRALPKRFFAAANLQQKEDGFCIALDGKLLRTPQGKLLQHRSQPLMQQMVAEWEAQAEHIDTDTMPLTRLLNIALDRVPLDREALLADMAGYAETDLVCYRAPLADAALPIDSQHAQLRALQVQHFDPILAWAENEYALRFVLTEAILPVLQPEASVRTLAELFAAASGHELAALAMLVPLLGSAVLALAVWKGGATVEAAITAAQLDEAVQAVRWGEDPETAAKWQHRARDIRACAFFLTHK
jgi:chaperone required for assembly of F1-ATPase